MDVVVNPPRPGEASYDLFSQVMNWVFYAPVSKDRGHIVLPLSVCLHKLNLKHEQFPFIPKLNLLTRLIFGMKAYLINMHLLVPRSRSSAKVKVTCKGDISQKMAVSWAFVFHKHILFS